jgi:hypothetical protein
MDDGRRRDALADWLASDLPARFAERILPTDRAVAEHWSDLMAQSRRSGVALSVMDGFFAATAGAKDLTLVTRNVILHHLACRCSTRGTNKWPTVKIASNGCPSRWSLSVRIGRTCMFECGDQPLASSGDFANEDAFLRSHTDLGAAPF